MVSGRIVNVTELFPRNERNILNIAYYLWGVNEVISKCFLSFQAKLADGLERQNRLD